MLEKAVNHVLNWTPEQIGIAICIGICILLLVAVIVVVFFLVLKHKNKKREKESQHLSKADGIINLTSSNLELSNETKAKIETVKKKKTNKSELLLIF